MKPIRQIIIEKKFFLEESTTIKDSQLASECHFSLNRHNFMHYISDWRKAVFAQQFWPIETLAIHQIETSQMRIYCKQLKAISSINACSKHWLFQGNKWHKTIRVNKKNPLISSSRFVFLTTHISYCQFYFCLKTIKQQKDELHFKIFCFIF